MHLINDLPLKTSQISINDRKALHHILVTKSYSFPKPGLARDLLTASLGLGNIPSSLTRNWLRSLIRICRNRFS